MGEMFLVYGVVYLITNLVNGKVYVGQTTISMAVRLNRHFNNAEHPGKKDMHFYHALRLYGRDNFRISLLCSCVNQNDLNLMEDLYIVLYEAMNSDKGYNCKRGGAHGKFSEESRKRLSLGKTGIKHSDESRRRRSEKFRGKNSPNFGRRHTAEAKKKMSENRKAEKHYKYRNDVPTEEIVRLYQTMNGPEIAKIFDTSVGTIYDRLEKADVTIRTQSDRPGKLAPKYKKEVDTSELIRLYFEEGKNAVQISKMVPLTPCAIGSRIKAAGFKMRPPNGGFKLKTI